MAWRGGWGGGLVGGKCWWALFGRVRVVRERAREVRGEENEKGGVVGAVFFLDAPGGGVIRGSVGILFWIFPTRRGGRGKGWMRISG